MWIQKFNENTFKNIFSDWKILSMDELLQLLWVQYNNLKEKEEIVNEINEILEKYDFRKNIKEVPNYRNYWQFKEIIKKLVLEWKNSVEILEELWYETLLYDQRSLQQYVRKNLWLNIKKRIPIVEHKEKSNRFDYVSKEHFLENISQSTNLTDLKKKFWLTERNSNATKELFEKIQELWLDISHLKNVLTKETMYNFRDHIQTITKCLQEWKDLSEILHEIWIEETQHSRKMLRKFIKNKDRLMNIKLETTWNTYFQDKRNEHQEILQHKNDLKSQDFNEYQKENWDEEKIKIFKKLDNIWKENLQKIINEVWTFDEFRDRLKISNVIKFKQLHPYFISKWIDFYNIYKDSIDFSEYHDKIIELSNKWLSFSEMYNELWIRSSISLKNNFKFYLDTNWIKVNWRFNFWKIFRENKENIILLIKCWNTKEEIIEYLFTLDADNRSESITKWKLRSKLNKFIVKNNLWNYYENLSKAYTYEDLLRTYIYDDEKS